MHVPGADRPDPIARLTAPEGEGHQHQAGPVALPDGEEARLDPGVRQVRRQAEGAPKDRLDRLQAQAMLLAFAAVAFIPVEPCDHAGTI